MRPSYLEQARDLGGEHQAVTDGAAGPLPGKRCRSPAEAAFRREKPRQIGVTGSNEKGGYFHMCILYKHGLQDK